MNENHTRDHTPPPPSHCSSPNMWLYSLCERCKGQSCPGESGPIPGEWDLTSRDIGLLINHRRDSKTQSKGNWSRQGWSQVWCQTCFLYIYMFHSLNHVTRGWESLPPHRPPPPPPPPTPPPHTPPPHPPFFRHPQRSFPGMGIDWLV